MTTSNSVEQAALVAAEEILNTALDKIRMLNVSVQQRGGLTLVHHSERGEFIFDYAPQQAPYPRPRYLEKE